MESLKVFIQPKARQAIEDVYNWYWHNLELKAANAFLKDTYHTIELVSKFPLIGTILNGNRKTPLYSFPIHRKYLLVYRFNKTSIYIIAIRATMKKNL